MRKLNPEMLMTARQYKGMTQAQLAKKLKVTQGRISKIEMGVISCPDELLDKIVEVIESFTKEFYYQQKKIYGLPLSVHKSYY